MAQRQRRQATRSVSFIMTEPIHYTPAEEDLAGHMMIGGTYDDGVMHGEAFELKESKGLERIVLA